MGRVMGSVESPRLGASIALVTRRAPDTIVDTRFMFPFLNDVATGRSRSASRNAMAGGERALGSCW